MLTDKELAAVPEEALTEADVRKLRRLGQKKLRQA